MNTTAIDLSETNEAPPPSPAAASPAETEEKRPRKLGRSALTLSVLLIVGITAGFIPRWRQRAAAAADTRELALPSVTLVSPAPGEAAEGSLLPAEIKPSLEA